MEFLENSDNFDDIYINLTNIYSKEINYRQTNPYFKYEKILSYYTLFLIVIGTISNLVSFIVMNRKHMRKYACMKYLSALAISDMLILYQWNLNTFFKYNFARPPFYLDLEEISLVTCRIIAFGAFFCLQLSAWLLSWVSFDRLMLVYSTRWKHYMHKPIRIRLAIFATAFMLFITNSHLLFLNGYVVHTDLSSYFTAPPASPQVTAKPLVFDNTKTILSGHVILTRTNSTKFIYIPKSEVVCYRSLNDNKYIFPKWEKAHLFLYSIIPFSIMLVSNSLIIYNVKYGQKVESQVKSSMKRKRRMTCMLCLVTFAFILLTLPSVVVHTFFREMLKKKTYRRFVNLIVNNLLHTSHAINFFLYVFSAPNFRAEILSIFNYRKILWFTSSTTTNKKSNNGGLSARRRQNTNNQRAVASLLKRFSNTNETIHSLSTSGGGGGGGATAVGGGIEVTRRAEIQKLVIENRREEEQISNDQETVENERESDVVVAIAETSTSQKQIRFNL